MAVGGQGPAAGQGSKGVPQRYGKDTLKQRHHYSSKGRVHKGVHGDVLQRESLSWQMTHLTGVEIAVALHRLNTPYG